MIDGPVPQLLEQTGGVVETLARYQHAVAGTHANASITFIHWPFVRQRDPVAVERQPLRADRVRRAEPADAVVCVTVQWFRCLH